MLGILWLNAIGGCSAQHINKIAINLAKDTLYSYTDAKLEIKIDRTDGQDFVFPKKYGIGNETQMPATLVYIVEKQQNDTS